MEHFRHLLLYKFLLKTDHKNIKYFQNTNHERTRLAMWEFKLQDYNFKIVYIPKEKNPANGLSRI